MSQPIAIVGIGCRFARADDLQAFWEISLNGEDTFAPIPTDRWDHASFFDANPRSRDKSYCPTGSWISDIRSFPAVALQMPPRRVEVMDPQQRIALEMALAAIEDSGHAPEDLPRMTGVYMGVTAVEYRTISSARLTAQMMASGAFGRIPENAPELGALAASVENVIATRPYTASGLLSNMVAATITQELRLRGPSFTTDAACASSLVAIDSAVKALRDGSVDCALAGGIYLCITPEHHVAFSRIGAISKQGKCLPFDQRADGFVQGDGAGILMLKRLSDAERDGDRVYAVLHGIGMNNDGGENGPMAPVKEGQIEVIGRAWDDAGLAPTHLGYVECHGTGTLVGDHIEFDGLATALGDKMKAAGARAGIGSSKANFGHTMSAAGVTGVIRAVMAIHHGQIPPMANFESPKPDLPLSDSPFYIPKDPVAWTSDARLACVSSFGFGGTNVHIVLGNRASVPTAIAPALPPVAARTATSAPELVLMSAPDEATLRKLAAHTAAAIRLDATTTLAGVARAFARRRRQPARLAIVAHSVVDLADKLADIGQGGHPKGAFLGTHSADLAPKVAFLYPGQGAQRVGMIAGLRDRFPVVAQALSEMDAATAGLMAHPVTHYLYPERRGEANADQALADLTETQNTQPALFAVGYALTALLRSIGIRPDVVAGHSVGEFTAATSAGLLSPADGVRWCARRGQGMASMSGDRGAMAAWVCDRHSADKYLVPGAIVANVNHPRQVVISGATALVAASNQAARAAGIEVTELRVSHGFHSPVFESLNLDSEVDKIEFLAHSEIQVASCISDAPYADADTARAVFKRHARSPVLWTDALQRCKDLGAEVYLQVGAGGPLLSFVRGTLPGAPAVSLAGKEDNDHGASLLEGLGQLFTAGVDLDPTSLIAPAPLASVPPTVLARERYWIVADQPVDAIALKTPGGLVKPGAGSHAKVPAPSVGLTVDGRGAGESAEKSSGQPASAPAARESDPLSDIVFAAVAKASAYPRAALRPTMKLGDDLGFDSMMVADLAEELRKQIPGFSGIPQELLINAPTIADIVAYVQSPGATTATVAVDDDRPLEGYAPTWLAEALPTFGARELAPQKVFFGGDVAALSALSLPHATRVESAAEADLIVFAASSSAPVQLSAVLSGEADAPDPAGALVALLDARAQAGKTADLLVLVRDDDLWAEALGGVVRVVAREWPDRVAKFIRGGLSLSSEVITAELRSTDRSSDIRYVDGLRHVPGLVPATVAAAAPLTESDVVVITGGTRGIGRKLALRLAASVGKVILVGRGKVDIENVLADKIISVAADVTDRASLVAALEPHRPTVLIHSAGLLADGALGSVDPERGRDARLVKALGLMNAVVACGPRLTRVLALGSWAARFGNRHQAHYAAGNALMSAIAAALPERITAVTAEFGPWTDSDMVQSIPEAMRQAMRTEGVDFVGTTAGLDALVADLARPSSGVIVRGRDLPATLRRGVRQLVLSVESHPFLKDHAVPSDKGPVPVFPIASSATLVAETAGLDAHLAPFEVRDLRLFQGLAVKEPLALECSVLDGKAEIRQGDKRVLSYRAEVRSLSAADLASVPKPAPLTGGEAGSLPLAKFYGGVTFHGKLLQGITSIDGVGPDFVRGKVKTSRPGDWVRAHDLQGQTRWAIDPLAFDSAMQLAAYVAWVRYRRAGTPVGFGRWVQLRPWPAAAHTAIIVEARFEAADVERLSADLVFRDDAGEIIAMAFEVVADMKKVEAEAAAESVPVDDTFVPKPEWTDPSKWRGYKDLAMRLYAVDAMGLRQPYFDLHEGTARNTSMIGGREVVNFSSYNYIGLSGDERVITEVVDAIHKYGTSVSASRVASGERPFHRDLERELAAAHGMDDALVMAGGHATNVNTIGHLFGAKDLILHDELIHDSCIQGIKLSGAARRSFKHEDIADLERQLKELRRHYEKVLILVEGVYSMDGDIANIPEYVRLKKKYGTLFMVDEAHSFGTVGARGRGVGELFGMDDPESDARKTWGLVRNDVDIWMGTMSKSLASMGGWIAARKELITYLRYTTPGFVFAAGIPPALGQAALSSLRYMLAEPERVANLQRNSKRFYTLLKERGLDTGPATGDSPVIPVITGDSMWALKLSERLLYTADGAVGINAKPIIFPAVANDAARLRFFMTSLHTEDQLVYTADRIKLTLDAIRAEAPKK